MGLTPENCDWVCRFYYSELAEPPRVPGELAIETIHRGDVSKDSEVAAGKRRFDIGRIEVTRGPLRAPRP